MRSRTSDLGCRSQEYITLAIQMCMLVDLVASVPNAVFLHSLAHDTHVGFRYRCSHTHNHTHSHTHIFNSQVSCPSGLGWPSPRPSLPPPPPRRISLVRALCSRRLWREGREGGGGREGEVGKEEGGREGRRREGRNEGGRERQGGKE